LSANLYQVGDKIRLSAAFTNLAEAAQDPGGVQFKILEPDGTLTTYVYSTDVELVKDSTGNYHVDWVIDQSGRHRYRFAGVTSGQAADEKEFNVQKTRFE